MQWHSSRDGGEGGALAQGVNDELLGDGVIAGDGVAAAGVVEQLHVLLRVHHIVHLVVNAPP